MSAITYIFGIISALVVLLVVGDMLRRGKLRERHAIWWLFGGVLGLIIGVFPVVLEWAANLLGIEVPTNLVFFVSIGLLFLVHIQQSAELTLLEERNRSVAESHALLEIRVRNLEGRDSDSL
ncbi:DUF2304 domain-containing protein [Leucobacter sp. W1153]|uniref:DUF2304 domain-containing protein n=1 Tax=Leucobacter sp. W1153 TaxID=3439064 RepID=UPI003F3F28FC